MELSQFLSEQEKVYNKFRDTSKVASDGIKSHTLANYGAYAIIYRHNQGINNLIESASSSLKTKVPILSYPSNIIHTTMSDYNLKPGFSPENSISEKLCDSLHKVKNDLRSPCINYKEWLFNQSTLIVAGYPDSNFIENAVRIQQSAKNNGLELRLPWGAHITAGRFTKDTPANKLGDFYDAFKEFPQIGQSNPNSIVLGYVIFNGADKVDLTILENFSLA